MPSVSYPTGPTDARKGPSGADEKFPGAADTAAVLVVHGIGQQDRNSTLADVVRGLSEADDRVLRAAGLPVPDPKQRKIELRTVKIDGETLPCALMTLQRDGKPEDVHVYEAYWAPLAVGKTTLRSCIKFLARAGWQGTKRSLSKDYRRWLFNQEVQAAPRSVLRAGAFFLDLLAIASLVI